MADATVEAGEQGGSLVGDDGCFEVGTGEVADRFEGTPGGFDHDFDFAIEAANGNYCAEVAGDAAKLGQNIFGKVLQIFRQLRFGGASGPSTQDGFGRSEEHTSELQSQSNLVCRLLLEKKKRPSRPARDLHNAPPQLDRTHRSHDTPPPRPAARRPGRQPAPAATAAADEPPSPPDRRPGEPAGLLEYCHRSPAREAGDATGAATAKCRSRALGEARVSPACKVIVCQISRRHCAFFFFF